MKYKKKLQQAPTKLSRMSNPAAYANIFLPQNDLCDHIFVPLPHTTMAAVPHVCLMCKAEAVFDIDV